MARRILFLSTILFSIILVCFSNTALQAAREGLALFASTVLPALFPFFVCTSLLQNLGALHCTPKKSKLFQKLRIPLEALPMMALSAISGAPTGARLAASLEKEGSLPPPLGTQYAALFNLASPMFLCGALASGMLGCPRAALPILLGQYVSCFLLLIAVSLFQPLKPAKEVPQEYREPVSNLRPSSALVSALWEGVQGMLRIGASIVFFLVLIRLLQELGVITLLVKVLSVSGVPEETLTALLTGVLEMTSGCQAIACLAIPLRLRAAFCAAIVTFGGICLLLQSFSFYPLKAVTYLLFKTLQAGLAFLIAYLTAPWFLQESASAFAPITKSELTQNLFSGAGILSSLLLGLSIAWIFAAVCKKRMRRKLHIR